MRDRHPLARFSSVMFAVQLLVIIGGACIAVGAATRQMVSALSTMTGGEVTQTSSFIYWNGGMTRVPQSAALDLKGTSFSITAQLEIPPHGATGMIVTQGGLVGGWAFYVESGKPAFHYHAAGVARYTIAAERPLEPGQHTLKFAFNHDASGKDGGGTGVISTNGTPIAQGRIEQTIQRLVSFDEGLDIGEDTGTPVNLDYEVPFKFTGGITEVTVRGYEPPRFIAVPGVPIFHR
jgi:hypothetical protein